jgi:O-6-methylguanine DNA methyltransferase
MINYTTIETPLGKLLLAERDDKLCLLEFPDSGIEKHLKPIEAYFDDKSEEKSTPILIDAKGQLSAYFAGKLKKFELPLIMAGTDWQKTVWNALLEIPYGNTVTYGWLAEKGCTIKASRAVGRANGANPISIIVPCHRVIGKDGKLVGYGGELWRKKWLLEHEGHYKGHGLVF